MYVWARPKDTLPESHWSTICPFMDEPRNVIVPESSFLEFPRDFLRRLHNLLRRVIFLRSSTSFSSCHGGRSPQWISISIYTAKTGIRRWAWHVLTMNQGYTPNPLSLSLSLSLSLCPTLTLPSPPWLSLCVCLWLFDSLSLFFFLATIPPCQRTIHWWQQKGVGAHETAASSLGS